MLELGNGKRKWLEMDLVCRRKWENIAEGRGRKKEREKDFLLLSLLLLFMGL